MKLGGVTAVGGWGVGGEEGGGFEGLYVSNQHRKGFCEYQWSKYCWRLGKDTGEPEGQTEWEMHAGEEAAGMHSLSLLMQCLQRPSVPRRGAGLPGLALPSWTDTKI